MNYIDKYFAKLDKDKIAKLKNLAEIYKEVNEKINVISRRDIENFDEHHLLPALGISKIKEFKKGETVLDIGSGGGLPGIPLAIIYPETIFTLTDSRLKKADATNMVLENLNLTNVVVLNKRSNEIKEKFDYVIGRAVTQVDEFVQLAQKNLKDKNKDESIFYIAGAGESEEDISSVNMKNFYKEDYFLKKCIYVK